MYTEWNIDTDVATSKIEELKNDAEVLELVDGYIDEGTTGYSRADITEYLNSNNGYGQNFEQLKSLASQIAEKLKLAYDEMETNLQVIIDTDNRLAGDLSASASEEDGNSIAGEGDGNGSIGGSGGESGGGSGGESGGGSGGSSGGGSGGSSGGGSGGGSGGDSGGGSGGDSGGSSPEDITTPTEPEDISTPTDVTDISPTYIQTVYGPFTPTDPTNTTNPTNPTAYNPTYIQTVYGPFTPTNPTNTTNTTNPTDSTTYNPTYIQTVYGPFTPTNPTNPTNATNPTSSTDSTTISPSYIQVVYGPFTPTDPTSPINPTSPTNPTNPTNTTNPSNVNNPLEPNPNGPSNNQGDSNGQSSGNGLNGNGNESKIGLGLTAAKANDKDTKSKLLGSLTGSKKKSSIIEAVERGASRLGKSVTPILSGEEGVNGGVVALAGLAGAGALGGAGLLLAHKYKSYTFTPDDWEELDKETQAAIMNDMRQTSFNEEEIEKFKISTFKIPASELNEHTKRINRASEIDSTVDSLLTKLYNYSLLDDEENADNYLTFITMIIDGKTATDDFNMYNVLNPILEIEDDVEFLYTGIDMDDYIIEEDEYEETVVEETSEEA